MCTGSRSMKYTVGLMRMSPTGRCMYRHGQPEHRPSAVPTSPMIAPWITNTRPMPRAVSPIARRMPISRVLSATTIVRVPTMLNAATIMMMQMMSPMPSFSSSSAEKSCAFWACQSSER